MGNDIQQVTEFFPGSDRSTDLPPEMWVGVLPTGLRCGGMSTAQTSQSTGRVKSQKRETQMLNVGCRSRLYQSSVVSNVKQKISGQHKHTNRHFFKSKNYSSIHLLAQCVMSSPVTDGVLAYIHI